MSALSESNIRWALDDWVRAGLPADGQTLIRHELGVCANQARVDVAIVNGVLAGYEIKSDEDSLRRLPDQISAYGKVLDRAVLVTTRKHMFKGGDFLPRWWGLMLAEAGSDGQVHLRLLRKGRQQAQQDPYAIAQMLWRDECLEELRTRGLGRGMGKAARHYLWAELAAVLPQPELRHVVRERLRARQDWPGVASRH